MTTGLLVVDVQPAYGDGCGVIAAKVAQRINNTVKPVTIMWVGEGLTSDCEADVYEYLRMHGARPGRLATATFVEKNYGFFRGWMDNRVPHDDIVNVGRHMLSQQVYSSQCVDMTELYGDAVPDFPEYDELGLPSFDDNCLRALSTVEVCGGGRDECLAEVELWLRMIGKPFKRLPSMVY